MDKKIKVLMSDLLSHVESCGGFVHPEVRLYQRGENFGVRIKGKPEVDELVMSIPYKCMPNLDNYNLSLQESGSIFFEKRAGCQVDESSPQHRSMELMMEIYNASNKVVSYIKVSPLLNHGVHDELLRIFAVREPSFVEKFKKAQEDGVEKLFVFLESRIYQDKAIRQRVLLPVIDLVDHHSFADAFRPVFNGDGSEKLLSLRYKTVLDGRQVFASYSLMDAFHSWIKYGFVDGSSFFVQSIPVDIKIDRAHVLKIGAFPVNSTQLDPDSWSQTDSNARFYAAQFDTDENTFAVGFMLIPPVQHMRAFYEVLQLYLRTWEGRLSLKSGHLNNKVVISKIAKTLVNKNAEFYYKINSLIKNFEKCDQGASIMLNAMIKKQMGIIKAFNRAL